MTGHFRKKYLFFQDTREHPEHDAKNRLSLSITGSEKTLAEIESVKRKLTLSGVRLKLRWSSSLY